MQRLEQREVNFELALETLNTNIEHIEIRFYGFRTPAQKKKFSPETQTLLLNKSLNLLDYQLSAYETIIGNYKRQIQDFIIQNKYNNPNYKTPKLLLEQMEQFSVCQSRLDKLKQILKQHIINEVALSNQNDLSQDNVGTFRRRPI